MTRSCRFVCVLVSVFQLFSGPAPASKSAQAADQPTNVVLIMADDIGIECFGCYGSQTYSTPNIDRMAAEGLRFTQCHAQPLCTPTRVKLMTGLSNVRNYAAFSVLRRDQHTIGQMFQQAGYETAVAGKWQLLGAEHYKPQFRGKGTWPADAGFDRTCLWQVDQLGSRYWNPLLYTDGTNVQHGENDYGPRVVTNFLLDFIEENKDGPFFAYYPMILVHNPFEPTPDSQSREYKKKHPNFRDMVAYMDTLVGEIVDKTEQLGIADRTLVIFTGDNGTNRGITSEYHGKSFPGGKGKTTDAGTHVPLVVRWKGITPAGQTCDDLVDFSDFLPTLLEVSDIEVPEGLDGRSFYPQLRGETGNPRESIFCYYNPRPERTEPVRFARDKRYKLYAGGALYDLEADPGEKHPLDPDDDDAQAAHAREKLAGTIASMPAEGQSLLQFSP